MKYTLLFFILWISELSAQTYNRQIKDSLIADLFNFVQYEKDTKGRARRIFLGENILRSDSSSFTFYKLDSSKIDHKFMYRQLLKHISPEDIVHMKNQIVDIAVLEKWNPKTFNRDRLKKHKEVEELRRHEKYQEISIPIFSKDKLKCVLLRVIFDNVGIGYVEELYIHSKQSGWQRILTLQAVAS